MKQEYLNEETMCYEYPNGELKETFEQRINLELLILKWQMRNMDGYVDVKQMFRDFDRYKE